jgi:hypothetical protein
MRVMTARFTFQLHFLRDDIRSDTSFDATDIGGCLVIDTA